MPIPKRFQPHINAAFPDHVIMVGTVLPDGFAQITPRGSIQVFDDNTISVWERGIGKTQELLKDGTPVTMMYANMTLISEGLGFVRMYGTARIHRSGPVYDKVWGNLIEPERKQDPEKKGFAVLIELDRVENLRGVPVPE